MKTTREKITFILSALVYLLFNLGYGENAAEIARATLFQLLGTLPFVGGATMVVSSFIRFLSDNEWPPWDRIARIYFTIGILVGFFMSLYQHAEGG